MGEINNKMNSLIDLVDEMREEFLISGSYSQTMSIVGDSEEEAQDVIKYIKLKEHAYICKQGAKFCADFLDDHNLNKLIYNLNLFKFYENVLLIRNIIFSSA